MFFYMRLWSYSSLISLFMAFLFPFLLVRKECEELGVESSDFAIVSKHKSIGVYGITYQFLCC